MGAARILNDNEETFQKIAEKKMQGEAYRYFEAKTEEGDVVSGMVKLSEEDDGIGLVLTRYNTAFSGHFADGSPEGEVCAVQTMILEQPRYTFADGIWENGVMNGEGKTGYHYYMNAPKSGFIYTEKTGTYLENQLNGIFEYRTENGAGETLTWNIQADKGATVINENWIHDSVAKEYMLPAQESAECAYVLAEERASAVIWNNLVLWDK